MFQVQLWGVVNHSTTFLYSSSVQSFEFKTHTQKVVNNENVALQPNIEFEIPLLSLLLIQSDI